MTRVLITGGAGFLGSYVAAALAARPDVELVVAAARNGVIGRDGAMPWSMPSDLKLFRIDGGAAVELLGTALALEKPLQVRARQKHQEHSEFAQRR